MAVHHPGGCGIIPCRQGHRLRTCMARGLVGAAHGDFDADSEIQASRPPPTWRSGQIATADDNLSACVHLGAVLISCSGNGPAVEDIARSQRGLDRLCQKEWRLGLPLAASDRSEFQEHRNQSVPRFGRPNHTGSDRCSHLPLTPAADRRGKWCSRLDSCCSSWLH